MKAIPVPALPLLLSAMLGAEPVLVDGQRDDVYGPALAVQTIETGFGDNMSEWNAAYGRVSEDHLHLLFTGNLEDNFNKLEIFIDTNPDTGFNVFPPVPGNDGSASMAGMTFDAGFTPEFHLIARRGLGKFDLDFARLGEPDRFTFHENIFSMADQGVNGFTRVGLGNSRPLKVAFFNDNLGGIGGTAGAAANQEAALSVTTGFEIGITLHDLQPRGDIRVMLMQNNQGHDYVSNQTLPGLPVGTGNLMSPAGLNFANFDGDQFFTVPLPPLSLDMKVAGVDPEDRLLVTVGNIPAGETFHLRSSTDGVNFEPLFPLIDFNSLTPQPFRVRMSRPNAILQVWTGKSVP